MNKDKLAIWSFAVLFLSAIDDFLRIYEFGSIDAFWNYISSEFSNSSFIIILSFQTLWGIVAIIACVYLFITYPLGLISRRRNKK